jgi:hypothetical protein
MSLTRDEFFAASDRIIESVDVLLNGKKVTMFVRSLTGTERDEFESSNVIRDKKSGSYDVKMTNLRARLVEMAVCNEDGSRFFKQGDASQIGRKNARTIAVLYDVAARLSGITKEDLEDIAGESSADQSAGSTSA